jgi:hypothetical protein
LNCHLHPEIGAATTCVGCAEPFCENCFITIAGQDYCAVCKTMAISPGMIPATATCKEARDALLFALAGFVCFGIVVEPIAIVKAVKARALLKADPSLGGRGVADAALFLAVCGLLFGAVGLLTKLKP